MEHFQGPLPNGRQGAVNRASVRPQNLHTAQTTTNGLLFSQTQLPFQLSSSRRASLRKGEKWVPQDINSEGKFNNKQAFPQKSVQQSCRLEESNLKIQHAAAQGPEFRTKLRSSAKNDTTSVPTACQIRSAPQKTTTPRAKPVALTFEPNESKFCKVVQHTQIGAKEALEPTLAAMQRVYSQVLPGMRTETGRILRNWDYTSIVVTGQEVMGGCTFKYHRYESFIELTLLGVAWSCQEFGLGSSIIESLKLHASVKDFSTIVTYADNNAVPFFKKQGFQPLVPTDTSYELVKSTIVACCKSTLMQVAVPQMVKPTESETLRQLPNNTLMEIKPTSQSPNDCSEEEAIEQDASQKPDDESRPSVQNSIQRNLWGFDNWAVYLDFPAKQEVFVSDMPQNSAEDTQTQTNYKQYESVFASQENINQEVMGSIAQSAEKPNSTSSLQRQHSVNYSINKPCRTAMKEPIRSLTVVYQKDTDHHSDIYDLVSSMGTSFGYYHQSKVEPLNLHDADEVYPSDLDMLSESQEEENERSYIFQVPIEQSALSAFEIEPMFPCQDVRTEVVFSEPTFAKYKSIITTDKTSNLKNSFILQADTDQLNQPENLSKEDVMAQYFNSVQTVVLPRVEAFKNDFIFDSCSINNANEFEEIVNETPIRRKVIEDMQSVPVAVQKQRKQFFAQLSELVSVDASDSLRRSEQFSSLYQKNEVTGQIEIRNVEPKFLSKEKFFDFNSLDQELLGEDQNQGDYQKIGKNLSMLSTTMPQERSANKSFEADRLSSSKDCLAIKQTEHTETPKNQLINDFNRQHSKNTFNSTDTTCIGTTPENTEVSVGHAVKDCKLDFKDVKVFKTIVFDIFIQHENKLKELMRPSLAECFLVSWSKKALITSESNTEQKIAEWITMCQRQATLCSCIGSETSQPELEPSFDLWRKRDVKALSKL